MIEETGSQVGVLRRLLYSSCLAEHARSLVLNGGKAAHQALPLRA
jgi:hypothetical protein